MIHRMLTESLLEHTAKPAVRFASSGEEVTYGQLHRVAEGLGAALSNYDYDVLVILLPKSTLFYASIVHCLVSQRPFCPLDEETPTARVAKISGCFDNPVILHHTSMPVLGLEDFSLLASNTVTTSEPCPENNIGSNVEHAYYISTSGTTDMPKLVQGRQSALAKFATWATEFYEVNAKTMWAQFSSTGFDLTLVDIVTCLSAGATLVSLSSQFDRLLPLRAIERHQITHWHSVPSVIPHLIPAKPADTDRTPRVFTFCGETLHTDVALKLRNAYPQARIINTYGPTEGTLFFTAHEMTESDMASVTIPIGRPIPGWNILLDPSEANDELECVIVSDFIAAGYRNSPAVGFGTLTVEGKSTDVFRTGDILSLDGKDLFFKRRMDSMVKIRGTRVDLQEIEAIARLGGAANPVAFKDGKVLHLVLELAGGTKTQEHIMHAFDQNLSPGLHPSVVSIADTLPRKPSGKIDRDATRNEFAKYER